jgi:hypothetical protein
MGLIQEDHVEFQLQYLDVLVFDHQLLDIVKKA